MLIPKYPSLLFIPQTPHGHTQEVTPHRYDNRVLNSFWEPLFQGLGWLTLLPIASSESHRPFLPYGRYECALIQEVTHGFLFLIAQA